MTRDVLFFRAAFLRHTPQRYALMLTPDEAQRLDQKYDERRGAITDVMLGRHLAGEITLAVPAAVDGHAHLLPLDVDAGGIAVIRALIITAAQRGLWAFGQSCPRPGLPEQDQRGYVWLVFDQFADASRLQFLGDELISAVLQGGWKIEPRAHAAVTRLPIARHTHTGRFGDLILADQVIAIDSDPVGALTELRQRYRENPVSSLPSPPYQPPNPSRSVRSHRATAQVSPLTATTTTTI